jgi:uncharacterized membrane protein
MRTNDVAEFVLAGYPTEAEAEAAWSRLRAMDDEGRVKLVDAAVVEHDAEGHAKIVKDLHHPLRKGVVIGTALALVTPVGLVAGVVGGAAAGAVAKHLHEGMTPSDERELSELLARHPFCLVAVVNGPGSPDLSEVLASTDVVDTKVSGAKAEFDRLLFEVDTA